MSVYDKELVINGKAVRSPEQQVYQNMKDIKALQETIKPEYNTTAELTEASVSVALSTTNAPEGTTEGWIITQDGLKFKINGGDETNLLLEFYCSIKGPQGEKGDKGDNGSDSLVTIEDVTINKNNFVESTAYTGYSYEYVITNDSAKGTVKCGMLLFDVVEANSGNYASICDVDGTLGTITIYSKAVPEESFVIPQIWLIKA